jgi:hypothetical protein
VQALTRFSINALLSVLYSSVNVMCCTGHQCSVLENPIVPYSKKFVFVVRNQLKIQQRNSYIMYMLALTIHSFILIFKDTFRFFPWCVYLRGDVKRSTPVLLDEGDVHYILIPRNFLSLKIFVCPFVLHLSISIA